MKLTEANLYIDSLSFDTMDGFISTYASWPFNVIHENNCPAVIGEEYKTHAREISCHIVLRLRNCM
jgi:hypothetical protein